MDLCASAAKSALNKSVVEKLLSDVLRHTQKGIAKQIDLHSLPRRTISRTHFGDAKNDI